MALIVMLTTCLILFFTGLVVAPLVVGDICRALIRVIGIVAAIVAFVMGHVGYLHKCLDYDPIEGLIVQSDVTSFKEMQFVTSDSKDINVQVYTDSFIHSFIHAVVV
jgi:hypothetical protein